jgi:menaquinone-dependent protoporphyrinogen IX oxidase
MDKSIVVVYFSRDGSTRITAEAIARRLDVGIVELKEKKPRKNFLLSGFRASAKRHIPPAGDPWMETAEAETLIIGAPIWAGNGNPLINGFLDRANLVGKTVYFFTLQADPGRRRSDEVLAYYTDRVEKAGGKVAGTLALTGASPGKTGDAAMLTAAGEKWPAL